MSPVHNTGSADPALGPRLPLLAAFWAAIGCFSPALQGKARLRAGASRRAASLPGGRCRGRRGRPRARGVCPGADAAGRRHSLLERLDESLVVGLRLLVAALDLRGLLLEGAALLVGGAGRGGRTRPGAALAPRGRRREAGPLLGGVFDRAEGVGDPAPADEGLPALDQAL